MGKSIYILSKGQGIYKIGCSNNPAKRLQSLATGSELKLNLIYQSSPIGNATQIESEIHRRHKDSRMNGEWFALKDVESVMAEIDNLVEQKGQDDMGAKIMLNTSALSGLTCRNATGTDLQVFCLLVSKMKSDNSICVVAKEVCKELGVNKSSVSRALKRLVEVDVIARGPMAGRCHTYRMNPRIAHRGSKHYASNIVQYDELRKKAKHE